VDDVDLNLLVAKAMLGSLKVQVRTASGGEEALDILSKESMDLVLMDCHMPGLDGYDVTRCVRGSPGPNRETPIVALSASAFAEDRERAMQSGMNDFATKPIELDSLRGVLERWTARVETT
jgi:CheY-like chemotaxis protein